MSIMKHQALQSYEAFLDFLEKEKVYVSDYGEEDKRQESWKDTPEMRKNRKRQKVLYAEWVSGGMYGGSCLGDRAESRGADPEEELEGLDKILTTIYPTIPYLQYKKIEKLIQRGERIISEYYGNYTNYDYKFIPIEDIYNFLVRITNE